MYDSVDDVRFFQFQCISGMASAYFNIHYSKKRNNPQLEMKIFKPRSSCKRSVATNLFCIMQKNIIVRPNN